MRLLHEKTFDTVTVHPSDTLQVTLNLTGEGPGVGVHEVWSRNPPKTTSYNIIRVYESESTDAYFDDLMPGAIIVCLGYFI